METMYKVRARVVQILGVFTIYLSMLMTIIGTYQIVTRYFFNKPSTISEELLTYSFTWMVLLASACVLDKRDRMRMGFLADKVSGSAKKYLEVIINLLTLALAGVIMICGGTSITKLTMIQTITSLRVPMGYIYVIVPVTGIIITVFSLMNAVSMLHTDSGKKGDAGV